MKIKNPKLKIQNSGRGSAFIFIVIISAIGATVLVGLLTFITAQYKNSQRQSQQEQSFQVAEAGIYWYRWYLAHKVEGQIIQVKNAFWESGQAKGVNEPYEADVADPEGGALGRYKIEVTPPTAGSTVVIVKSTGWTYKAPNVKRVIQVRFRQPAWCEYAVIADDFMRFGQGTEVFGMIHSNQGIRFDGVAHNIVSSSVPTFDDPDHSGANEYGVHTHLNIPPQTGVNDNFRPLEAPPNAMSARSDVFQAGRLVSKPGKSFNSLISDLGVMKEQAVSGGLYLGQATATVQFNCRWETSGKGKNKIQIWTCDESSVPVKGYHIVLKTNPAHSMDVSMVLGFDAASYQINPTISVSYGGHSYSVSGETVAVNYPIPASGIVFVENFAWVEGTLNGNKLTIAAADLSPNPVYKDIYINHNILYTDKVGNDADGPDILGLIAQNNISVGLYSDDILKVDAALLAQKGRVGRDYYSGNHRSTITTYGSIATKQRYGFAYTDGTGYTTRNLYFDSNLIYYPPPFFPTGDKYQIDLWEEL
jgi:hypothetical protein